VKRYLLSTDIPDSSPGVETWLRSRWDEKDKRIQQYHSSCGRFVGEPLQALNGSTERVSVYYYLSIAFWLVFMLLMIIIYAVNSMMWWLSFAISVFFVIMGYHYNGFEYFQARYCLIR